LCQTQEFDGSQFESSFEETKERDLLREGYLLTNTTVRRRRSYIPHLLSALEKSSQGCLTATRTTENEDKKGRVGRTQIMASPLGIYLGEANNSETAERDAPGHRKLPEKEAMWTTNSGTGWVAS